MCSLTSVWTTPLPTCKSYEANLPLSRIAFASNFLSPIFTYLSYRLSIRVGKVYLKFVLAISSVIISIIFIVSFPFNRRARHLWLAHRLARQLEAAQIVKLGPSRGQLHFIVRARVDHHFELPAPPALAPGKPKPTNINNDWWAAVAHEDVLSSTTSSAVGDGPFRHSNLLLVGAAAPLYDKRASGVPLNLRCGVDDQFAMGSPHVMDAYASLFPDLNDDFVKLLLLHRNDANGHTNERMMVRYTLRHTLNEKLPILHHLSQICVLQGLLLFSRELIPPFSPPLYFHNILGDALAIPVGHICRSKSGGAHSRVQLEEQY